MSVSPVSLLEDQRELFDSQVMAIALPTPDGGGDAPESLTAAEGYALQDGGKRIRPLLVYLAARELDPSPNEPALNHAACAIELIHTYSLVHDDLPAMDDDDVRRGRPSLHKAFNEATAILVGDSLQAKAFELLADAPGLSAEQRLAMIKVVAAAAGAKGMVGGQFVDIQATDSDMTLEELQRMHSMKTGALIRASLALGGIVAGASERQLAALDQFGTHIGLAFQVVDDILDIEGNAETLGKTMGKDSEANKPTYVKLLGLAGAKEEAKRLLQAALTALDDLGDSGITLRQIARYIVERDH